jgi:hypothetical protein
MSNSKFDGLIAAFENDYPDTDLFVYFGPIRRPFDDELIGHFEARVKRKNLVLMLTTLGGDPDAAYRIARCIQRNYGLLPIPQSAPSEKVSVFVDTFCASAGTLITLGASEMIMSEFAELSPLDIQIRKPDDAWERDSGLTPTQALDILERRSKSLFKQHFNQLRLDSELGLTTRTAVEVASTITTGLLSEIYAQIDPMRLGEVERLMGITAAYGERLAKYNLKEGALARLLAGYPSHGFVIDRCEAEELYRVVTVPKSSLKELGEWVRSPSQQQLGKKEPIKFFLIDEPHALKKAESPQVEAGDSDHEREASGGDGASTPRARARRGTPRTGGETAA